jgi:hypothetical protein
VKSFLDNVLVLLKSLDPLLQRDALMSFVRFLPRSLGEVYYDLVGAVVDSMLPKSAASTNKTGVGSAGLTTVLTSSVSSSSSSSSAYVAGAVKGLGPKTTIAPKRPASSVVSLLDDDASSSPTSSQQVSASQRNIDQHIRATLLESRQLREAEEDQRMSSGRSSLGSSGGSGSGGGGGASIKSEHGGPQQQRSVASKRAKLLIDASKGYTDPATSSLSAVSAAGASEARQGGSIRGALGVLASGTAASAASSSSSSAVHSRLSLLGTGSLLSQKQLPQSQLAAAQRPKGGLIGAPANPSSSGSSGSGIAKISTGSSSGGGGFGSIITSSSVSRVSKLGTGIGGAGAGGGGGGGVGGVGGVGGGRLLTCGVCKEPAASPCAGRCGHVCCQECWSIWLRKSQTCPMCRAPADTNSVTRVIIRK